MLFALMLFGNPPNKAYHQRTADILIDQEHRSNSQTETS